MLRPHSRSGSGGRSRQWLGVAAAVAFLAASAPAQAAPFAYVINVGADTVSQYDAGRAGYWRRCVPPSVAAGDLPEGVAVSPDGRSVYVVNLSSDTVSQYDVGPGGTLSPKSPPTVAAGVRPIGVAVSPEGDSVYVTNGSTSAPTDLPIRRRRGRDALPRARPRWPQPTRRGWRA